MSAASKREAMLKELALLEERKRRKRLARPPYTPTAGQLKVLSSTKRNVFNFSGNGGGKTALNVQFADAFARGINRWTGERFRLPAKVAFVCDTSRKIDERIIPEFRKWFDVEDDQLDKNGRPYTSFIHYKNGSSISFLTADADPLSFEGSEFSVVIVDEPLPRPLYIALMRSLRIKGHPCRFIFSGTAISQGWLRKEIFEPWRRGELPDTDCFNMRTEDNRANLAEGYIENFSRSLSEAEKKVRLEGGFFDGELLALAEHFNGDTHIIKSTQFHYDLRMPAVVAIDPHTSKPHTAIMLVIDRDDKAIARKELTLKANATEFAKRLAEWEKGYNVVDRVCDSAGQADMSSGEGMHSFIEGLQRNGVMVRATTFKEKSHEDLIERLREGLSIPAKKDNFGRQTPAIRVHEDCPQLIANIEQVTWQKNRGTGEIVPKLDTSTKDYLSCLGYALAIGVRYDIIKHAAPRYRTEAMPAQSQERKQVEKQRGRIIQARADRARTRFFRRITGA
jgi:hypothetical protein